MDSVRDRLLRSMAADVAPHRGVSLRRPQHAWERGSAEGWNIPNEVFTALPYIGTVLVMAARAWISQRRGEGTPWPSALGQPFFRA